MTGFICITTYLLIMLIICYTCKRGYSKALHKENASMRYKLSLIAILIFAVFFTLLNVYCTRNSVSMGGDRINYNANFIGIRQTSSVGLEVIFSITRLFSDKIETVFYLTSFLCSLLIFLAYKNWDEADSKAIVFLLSTGFVLTLFVNMKQIYTNVFAALYFSFCMKERTVGREVLSVGLIILACLFHPAGFILIPIFVFFMLIERSSKYTGLIILFLFLCTIFMEPILVWMAPKVERFFPSLVAKIYQYFSDKEGTIDETGVLAVIKGFPYYVLFLWGIINRRRLCHKIKNYDKYLILAVLGVIFGFSAAISYWLSRFESVFYLPMGVFYSILMRYESRNNKLVMGILIIGSSLFFTLRSFALVFINYGGF